MTAAGQKAKDLTTAIEKFEVTILMVPNKADKSAVDKMTGASKKTNASKSKSKKQVTTKTDSSTCCCGVSSCCSTYVSDATTYMEGQIEAEGKTLESSAESDVETSVGNVVGVSGSAVSGFLSMFSEGGNSAPVASNDPGEVMRHMREQVSVSEL